jgi:hypothetical protein
MHVFFVSTHLYFYSPVEQLILSPDGMYAAQQVAVPKSVALSRSSSPLHESPSATHGRKQSRAPLDQASYEIQLQLRNAIGNLEGPNSAFRPIFKNEKTTTLVAHLLATCLGIKKVQLTWLKAASGIPLDDETETKNAEFANWDDATPPLSPVLDAHRKSKQGSKNSTGLPAPASLSSGGDTSKAADAKISAGEKRQAPVALSKLPQKASWMGWFGSVISLLRGDNVAAERAKQEVEGQLKVVEHCCEVIEDVFNKVMFESLKNAGMFTLRLEVVNIFFDLLSNWETRKP